MQDPEITITYETLFELRRLEKNREELQTLSSTFLDDLAKYINEKQIVLSQGGMFVSDRDKNLLEQVKGLTRQLYELRERKIISLAVNKSRTGSSIIDTSALLKHEKEFFDQMVGLLDKSRETILKPLLEGYQAKPEEEIRKETRLVRFLTPVPKFVGEQLEVYGPFEEEDVANLPTAIADVLITKGRAQAME
ncbi:MAG: hypothetical protein V1837_03930 [Candidatus Woesearchaeota archaeon]